MIVCKVEDKEIGQLKINKEESNHVHTERILFLKPPWIVAYQH